MNMRKLVLGGLGVIGVIWLIGWLYTTAHNDKRNKYFCFAEDRYLTILEVKTNGMEYWLRSRNPDELRTYIVESYPENDVFLNEGKINYSGLATTYIKGNPDCCGLHFGKFKWNQSVRKQEYLSFKKPIASRFHLNKLFGIQENHRGMPSGPLPGTDNTWGAAFSGGFTSAPLLGDNKNTDYTRITYSMLACGNSIFMRDKTKHEITPFISSKEK